MEKVTQLDFIVALKEMMTPISAVKEESGLITVEGYMTVYNTIDSEGDVILPGAFDDFIERFTKGSKEFKHSIPLLYRHRWDMRVGSVNEMKADSKGVWVSVTIDPKSDAGKFVADLVSRKEVQGFSYFFFNGLGFMREGIRYISKGDIAEVTVTPHPANELALVKKFSKSKELYKNWKNFVLNSLKDTGLSTRESRILFAQGVKGLDVEDEQINLMNKILDGMSNR